MSTSTGDGPAYDADAIRAYLAEGDEALKVYINPAHMTYTPLYLARAHARHALGEPAESVMRELWLLAGCYADHGDVFLAKWPRHQFRRRRLVPLEAALIAGDPKTLKQVADHLTLDPMALMARVEPDHVTHEVRALTPFFYNASIENARDLAGTLAVLYWLALSTVANADTEGLSQVTRLSARVLHAHGSMVDGATGGLGRMVAIHTALLAMPGDPAAVIGALAAHGRLFTEACAARLADDEGLLKTGDGACDITVIALLAVAGALGMNLGPALAAHADDRALAVSLAYSAALGHTAGP